MKRPERNNVKHTFNGFSYFPGFSLIDTFPYINTTKLYDIKIKKNKNYLKIKNKTRQNI